MKNKLALVIFKYFPYGGLQRDLYNVAIELKKKDLELTIFCSEWVGHFPEDIEVRTIKPVGLTNHKKNQNFYEHFMKEVLQYQPDLIFGFNKMPNLDLYFAGDTCYLDASKQKSFLYKLSPRYKHFTFFEQEVFSLGKTPKILLLNEKQKNIFKKEYGTDDARLIIVPPGLPETWLDGKETLDLKNELGLRESTSLILFVGSDFARKGLDRAIYSLFSLRNKDIDSYLIVAGEDDFKPYAKLAEKLGIGNRVKYIGPRKDIRRLMLNSDILIHPAIEEAAGNVIVEAMCSCLPVLVSASVGYASLVIENKAGLVTNNPFDQSDLDRSLFELLSRNTNISFRNSLKKLTKKNFFHTRYSFIAELVEQSLNA